MRYIGLMFVMCMVAAAIRAEEPSPAIDAASVKDGAFESPWFKFHYELPKGWKALDDAKRVAGNQHLRDEYAHPVYSPNMPDSGKKKKPSDAQQTTPPTIPGKPKHSSVPGVPDNFSLMVASPNGVDSIDSAVLPRINIWVNHRIPVIDTPKDRALVLESLGQVVHPTTVVLLGGREFARVDVKHAAGPYHTLWVTAAGDYLIGFELRASNEAELQHLAETMRTVRFD